MTHIEQLIQDMCPYGVEYKKLGEVAEIDTGNRNRQDAVEDGQYPFYVRSKEIFRIDSYSYDEEAIIIPGEGGIGDIFHYVNGKYDLHQRAYRIHLTNKAVDTKFVYFYLTAHFKDYIIGKAVAATVTSIRKPMLQAFEIPVPPIEIQQRIVAILDAFSALAAELQAELQMRRKQYEYYRTRLLTPHSESNSADKSDDCNWEWKTFAELGSFYGGLSGKTKEDFKDGNAKYITYLNIGCNPALRFDILETVKVGLNEKQNSVKYGDALFTGSSETPDECAMSSVIIDQPTENIYLNSFCFGFHFNSLDGIWPAFYKHYFRCDAFRKAVRRTANGTTRFNVSKKEFAKLSIPIPPIAEQKRIADILDKFEKLISSMEEGIPAEQALQQKRYEYYRDLLLTFPRKAV